MSTRPIIYRTRGNTHGPITRLMSPGDLGQLLKPFVFLDLFKLKAGNGMKGFGMHPHSGIATLTVNKEGQVGYEDSTGKSGVLQAGDVEWMRAGSGVWHGGELLGDGAASGFQLWIALPPGEEHAPAESLYLRPEQITQAGPARVVLGSYQDAASPIPAPAAMNYLDVRLADGESWTYTPPAGHTVGWIALDQGRVLLADGDAVTAGELAVFEHGNGALGFTAQGVTSFVLGSAVPHPHELVMGTYSVHTSKAALAEGEAGIRRIGEQLQAQKRAVSAA
jgi:redox-sensitive bicupin YhaK (pirin superfamily)